LIKVFKARKFQLPKKFSEEVVMGEKEVKVDGKTYTEKSDGTLVPKSESSGGIIGAIADIIETPGRVVGNIVSSDKKK
jgi:hypothetical protein